MKRLCLERGFYQLFENMDIRSSLKEKIRRSLSESLMFDYESLCMTTERKLLSLPYITPDAVGEMKGFLSQYGLRLGMTEEEIEAYKDADYLKAHPELSVSIESTATHPEQTEDGHEESGNIVSNAVNAVLGDERFETSPLCGTGDTATGEQPYDERKEAIKAMCETLQDPLKWFRPDDFEWSRHQTRLFLLTSQPFFVRWFVPFKYRMKMAFKQSDDMINEYRKDMAIRSTFINKLKANGIYERWMNGGDIN